MFPDTIRHHLRIRRQLGIMKAVRQQVAITGLRLASFGPARLDPQDGPIVSLTSFPARINNAWIPIEAMLRQDTPPSKVVLVLNEDDFRGHKLPRTIRRQLRRGLEILWIRRDMRSYGKLLPVLKAYPDAPIVTIDDDILYEPWRLGALTRAAAETPGTIVGHRGWEIRIENGRILPYRDWDEADTASPSDRVLLTGVGAILYPPGVFDPDTLDDPEGIARLCPTADDIWFWAHARARGVPVRCLGHHGIRELLAQRNTPHLMSRNVFGNGNDVQFANVVAHLGLELENLKRPSRTGNARSAAM